MESFGGCRITITIVSAQLKKENKGELSPFVEFKYNNKIYKTKSLQNTYNPHWNETFNIELLDNDNSDLLFKVLDKVLILNDNLIGIVKVPISILRKKVPINEWFDIEPPLSISSNGNTSPTNLKQPQQLTNKIQLNLIFTYNEIILNRNKNDVSDDWFLLDNTGTKSSYNPNTSTTTTTTTTTNNQNISNIPDIQQVYVHRPAQTNQSSPPSFSPYLPPQSPKQQPISPHHQYIQPLQFPSTNTNNFINFQLNNINLNGDIQNNSNSNNNSNGNNSNGINGNSNSSSITSSPKMVYNLSNSYLNSMINFGDSIDQETIELLKATLKEESIYSGKDDMNMLSHCKLCNSKASSDNSLYLMEECLHNFCKNCLIKGITNQMKLPTISADINCLASGCNEKIPHEVLKIILGDQEYENYLNKTLEAVLQNNPDIIKCPNSKCGFIFERCSNNNDTSAISKPSFDGKKMSEEAAKHRMEYRFRCGKCSLEFCSSCFTSPYHDYYTCETYKEYLNSRKCRFCSSRINFSSPAMNSVQNNNSNSNSNSNNGSQDVCNQEECQMKLSISCTKTHKDCSHLCIGIAGEETCLPCMNEKCYQNNKYLQDDSELCNICWVESLNSAPTIQLECAHIFHFACIQKQINKKQGPRITFNNIECVICKKIVSHPSVKDEMDSILEFKKVIQTKASERFSYEALQKSKELEDKKSKYFQNPDLFALDRYVYYKCFKCQKPYFAGAARCDEGIDGYKEEELLCNSCLGVDKNGECKIHGVDYITWKCKFCCSEASYFCWNKTHFCTDCHTKQQKGEYLNKKPIEEIPKCPGIDKCPLKISHPHVEEVILGCTLCNNFSNF